MSREERKMAQIIASIERMEKETRAPGDDASRTPEAPESARQGKKGKKGKIFGVKFKTGKKLKVSTVAGGARAPFERKLTPKKRWIQLWSAQMDEVKEKNSSSSTEMPYDAAEDQMSSLLAVASSPVSEVKVAPGVPAPLAIAEHMETPKVLAPESVPTKVIPFVSSTPTGDTEPCALTLVSMVESSLQEVTSEKDPADTFKGTTTLEAVVSPQKTIMPEAICAIASSSLELRVETPPTNESSHLSPPLERNSPITTASISPSAKIKEPDALNNNTAAAAVTAAKFSPTATMQEKSVAEKQLLQKDLALESHRKSSSSSEDKRIESHQMTSSGRHTELVRKRSVELIDSPMSEEAKQRAERRRKRKSNWDVGDPRKGGSPVADPPISAAAAAANQQSFAKYPSDRPTWRSSQSMMDTKPRFQSGHRFSSFYNNAPSSAGRRGYYLSPLPIDRSRSAGRSSSRHNDDCRSTNYR